jgi:hypothetical protein
VIEASEIGVALPDVGRTGAATVAVEVNSGQTSRPQARSVGQHPPPRDAGHDRNPELQANVLEGPAVLEVGMVVTVGL